MSLFYSANPPHLLHDNNWLDQAIHYCLQRTIANLNHLESFPERTDGDQWICVEKDGWWVGGHWVGLIWLAYANTKDHTLEKAARSWAANLVPRQLDRTTHDLGFLFELSHILGYKLTNDQAFIPPLIQAAKTLCLRFNPRGSYFQAWGALDAPPELRGRAIIDTMMNLNLLFWATQLTGDDEYSKLAEAHARSVLKYQIRPDFSTSHVIDFDPESGVFIKQDTHQGLSATSCWSRGQSWAIYGFGNCYRAIGEPVFLDTTRKLAEYALKNLPPDLIPFWDYNSPEIPDDVRDSSAASILASALLNLSDLEIIPEKASYWQLQAESILKSLWENYSSRGTSTPSIMLHGTRSKPHGLMDHGLIYGDYYFFEALLNLASKSYLIVKQDESL